ncbi:MAG: 3-hydroxyacyl-CoA dehydrogenase family protein [Thermomicrobiales bacterium]|nr:3-hydroxyacyl-CoA dehydrogenase family protein [Thermomicrobiales bacterium]
MSQIGTVAVVGAGTMGAQIASLVALSGRTVKLWDGSDAALAAGIERAEREIFPALGERRGLPVSEIASGLGRLTAVGSMSEAVAGTDMVIEAVREELGVKQAVFSELSRLTPAILGTNSSSIPTSLIAPAVKGPERLLNMHFFAPIWVRSMLELMSCGQTSDDVMETAYDFGVSLGLVTARVNGESKGFIINRIWRAVKRESLAVVDQGVASPEDVDRLWMMFFQTQYAPFGIMDMVGLDVVSDIETSYQFVSQDPTDTPSPTLARMIAAGTLGEKTGSGFYEHPNPKYLDPDFLQGEE